MSKFEKLFWMTIVILAIVYGVLHFFAYKKSLQRTDETPILTTIVKDIEIVIDDNTTIRNNIQTKLKSINLNLQKSLQDINNTIDENIDRAFVIVYKNIDRFLDFHYSIKGEYMELGSAAMGKAENLIQENLFPKEFTTILQNSQTHIQDRYIKNLYKHLETLQKDALEGVDQELNSKLFQKLQHNIDMRIESQKIKIASFVGIAFTSKIISAITAKIALKAGSKAVGKGAIKSGAKVATSLEASASGAICGPFAWICAPIAGITAWFGSDAIIIKVDEKLHRKEFKKELIEIIDSQKEQIKHDLKERYQHSFIQSSKLIKEKIEKTSIKKRVRKKIKERVFR